MQPNPRILITSVISGAAKDYAEIPSTVNHRYAKYYGYDYYVENSRLSPRHPCWDKVLLALDSLNKGYDYVWIVDADLMILNHQINLLTNIIQPHSTAHVILSSDASNAGVFDKPWVNTGSIVYKNSEWTREFLSHWWTNSGEYLDKPLWEQSALNELIQVSEEIKQNIAILPEQALNSVFTHECNDADQFCLHLMAISNAERKALFEWYQHKVIYNK